MTDRPYTPASLADEWGCSAQHVRNLIDGGKLRAFRLGDKLLRIPADAKREFECRANTESDGSTEHSNLSGMTRQEPADATPLEPLTRARLGTLRRRSMRS